MCPAPDEPARLDTPGLAAVLDLLLETRGEIVLTGLGGSMRPVLRTGDRIRIDRAAPWRPGDVLFCRTADGGAVVHRLLRIEGDRVILKGDANVRPDPPIPVGLVVGRVTARIRGDAETDLTSGVQRVWGGVLRISAPAAPLLWKVIASVRSAWHALPGAGRAGRWR